MMEKLVRDNIQKSSQEKNDGRIFRRATTKELLPFFRAKILEECQEVSLEMYKIEADPEVSTAGLIEEMGDLYEVMVSIASLNKFNFDDILRAADKKRQAKGAFHNGTVMQLPSSPHKCGDANCDGYDGGV